MLIKEVKKSLKKINLPKSCSKCLATDSDYWHSILSCETPTEIELYEGKDKYPVVTGYNHYILCESCSKQYNKMSIEEQNYRRKKFLVVKCNCGSLGGSYV